VLEQPTFARGRTTLVDFGSEPLVVVYRAGQQVQRRLVDGAASLDGKARHLRFEFRRNVQVHWRNECLAAGVRQFSLSSRGDERQCRAVNVSKATLEGAFVDELALLQPTPGYMRLVKGRILCVWEQRRAEAKERTTEQRRRVSAIQQKLG
jgi:hypothetical protein